MIQSDWITSLTPGSVINTNMASSPYTLTTGLSITGSTIVNNTLGWSDNNMTLSGGVFSNALEVEGDANFGGDVKIQGRSIMDALDRIEERLAILRPNEVLEDKWEKLKDLGKAYREMEKDILEKEKIWKILNR